MAKRELAFQNHIIDSYKEKDGFCKKWASEWQKGAPDLIATLPEFGLHLAEVKHMPNLKKTNKLKNPLTPKQRSICSHYSHAGANVMALVIAGENTRFTQLYAFPYAMEAFDGSSHVNVPYSVNLKYDVVKLLRLYRTQFGWKFGTSHTNW